MTTLVDGVNLLNCLGHSVGGFVIGGYGGLKASSSKDGGLHTCRLYEVNSEKVAVHKRAVSPIKSGADPKRAHVTRPSFGLGVGGLGLGMSASGSIQAGQHSI